MSQMQVKKTPIFWVKLFEKIFGVRLIIIQTPQYRVDDPRFAALEKVIDRVRNIFECGYLGGMERLAAHLEKRQKLEYEYDNCHLALNGEGHAFLTKENAERIIARQEELVVELSA